MTYFLTGDSITLTLLVLLILIFAYYTYNLRTNNIFRRLGMPGPAPIPFLGETYNIIRKGLIKNDIDLVHKYGKIIGQAVIFLVAGYETTSILMSCFFYVMATEPVIQEKVYEEICQELGDDEVTHEKLNQLPYLDMVISETLRMYPPGIRFDRVASCDYQLGNYHIPKGSIINVSVYPIHHDPNVWPDPEKFIPERFLPAEKAKRHPMTYLPFGDGPRNCIGMRFALLEAKLGIAKALRVVEFQKCEKTQVPLQLGKLEIVNSKNGIWVRVVRRSQ
ncbi:unnamed protein product [Rotaria sordida]|uniref:Cytochrome P450 n=1 Tax=Rotaria sordida TaxID=392033 RepID=A0A815D4D9_9BILA|nr:unnamed protein product [Rotaria sordida]